MKKLIFILAAIFAVSAASAYTPPDSCLKMRCPDDYDVVNQTGTTNPDSVKVDSCDGSPTYGKRFAKRYFEAKFTQYPFVNLIGLTELKRVSDIRDDIPGLKQQFQELENELGSIFFKRTFVNNEVDSIWLLTSGDVTILFENYQDIGFILDRFPVILDSLNTIHYHDQDACEIVSVDDKPYSNKNEAKFNPNPVKDKIYFDFMETVNKEKICIFTMNGQKLFETEFQKVIDVSFLQDGIYYFTYNNKAYKFIKIK